MDERRYSGYHRAVQRYQRAVQVTSAKRLKKRMAMMVPTKETGDRGHRGHEAVQRYNIQRVLQLYKPAVQV
jgi:hypothetical protein